MKQMKNVGSLGLDLDVKGWTCPGLGAETHILASELEERRVSVPVPLDPGTLPG